MLGGRGREGREGREGRGGERGETERRKEGELIHNRRIGIEDIYEAANAYKACIVGNTLQDVMEKEKRKEREKEGAGEGDKLKGIRWKLFDTIENRSSDGIFSPSSLSLSIFSSISRRYSPLSHFLYLFSSSTASLSPSNFIDVYYRYSSEVLHLQATIHACNNRPSGTIGMFSSLLLLSSSSSSSLSLYGYYYLLFCSYLLLYSCALSV